MVLYIYDSHKIVMKFLWIFNYQVIEDERGDINTPLYY